LLVSRQLCIIARPFLGTSSLVLTRARPPHDVLRSSTDLKHSKTRTHNSNTNTPLFHVHWLVYDVLTLARPPRDVLRSPTGLKHSKTRTHNSNTNTPLFHVHWLVNDVLTLTPPPPRCA